jgi:hypothetical protein
MGNCFGTPSVWRKHSGAAKQPSTQTKKPNNTMKKIMLIILAVAPALVAAETNTTALTTTTNLVTAPQVDLAEQAQLVMEIGRDAAGDFDPELHARSLRCQIETLVITKPVKVRVAESGVAPPPQTSTTGKATAPEITTGARSADAMHPDVISLRATAEKLRAIANDLEAQIRDNAGGKP